MIRHSLLVATLFLSVGLAAACGTKNEDSRPAAKEADNTGVNTRDRAESAVTPTDQKENETDLRITQDIRKAIVDDGALSFDAKNIKIVTSGAVVTLRGPVKDEGEKSSIETKAKQVAGVTRVDNQLEVAR